MTAAAAAAAAVSLSLHQTPKLFLTCNYQMSGVSMAACGLAQSVTPSDVCVITENSTDYIRTYSII